MRKTVAIVGSHPGTRSEFDFSRDDCDIWVFNEAPQMDWVKRADAVFQMHEEAIWRNPKNRNNEHHYEWLHTQEVMTVYMQDKYPDVPMSVRFPLEEITARYQSKYFTSSPCFALALAGYLGYQRVEMYGIEMETQTEYVYQRDGITFWLGILKGQGVDVDAHCKMFDSPMYGYEGEVVLKYDVFVDRIEELTPLVNEAVKRYEGARAMTARALEKFIQRGENPNAVPEAIQKQLTALGEYGKVDGARQEAHRYKTKADAMREAADGEFLFSRQEFEAALQALVQQHGLAMRDATAFAGRCEVVFNDIVAMDKRHKRIKAFQTKFIPMLDAYVKKSAEASLFAGAGEENRRMLGILDKHIRAAGGSKAEEVLLEAAR